MTASEKRIISTLVNELGRLDRELITLKKKKDRIEVIRPELIKRLDLDPDQAVSVNGSRYIAQIGEQCWKRSVFDMPQLFALLGQTTFLENCSFPLERVDYLLNPAQRQTVLEEKRIGARSWKTFMKTIAAKA